MDIETRAFPRPEGSRPPEVGSRALNPFPEVPSAMPKM